MIGTSKQTTVTIADFTFDLSRLTPPKSHSYTTTFTTSTQSVPPPVPVYSYHCTQSGCDANTLPRLSQGQLSCQFKWMYSKAIQKQINEKYPVVLPNLLLKPR